MSILANIGDYFIHFGTGLAFLLCLLELLRQDKTKYTSLYLIGFFLGLIQLRIGYIAADTFNEDVLQFPLLIFLMASSILMIGPLALRLGYSMLDFAIKKERMSVYHFLPSFIILLIELVSVFIDSAFRISILQDAFINRVYNFPNIILLISFLHVLTYFIYILILFYFIDKEYDVNLSRFAYSILFSSILTILFIGFGYFLHSVPLFRMGGYGITFSLVLIYIFSTRHPKLFISLKNEIQQQKYKKSLLDSVNLEAIYKRIDELMNDIKIYTDEDLRMHHFAEELLITPHQLSRLLNKHYQKNFNEFINSFRVEDAKQQLIDFPKKNILMIAYDAGFNTKATFNSQFLKITKMTPAEYRKKKQQENKNKK